ncbi:helix-turn-helix domain-containing protein [Rhodanobacter sp. OK091]|uniref:helix-turn-helix domain-containing protein n=1 Tax=Rhodanobacter sp. OK091 TaxID=1881037 RepID=UPI000934F22D|nr:helix-turn-helix domain-containing protein [Rhodanobacter sp. OK091]
MAGSDGEILTLDEVAAFLKAGKRTVYRLAQNGQIPAFKLGGTWRFRRSELDSWIDANSNQRKPIGKAQR